MGYYFLHANLVAGSYLMKTMTRVAATAMVSSTMMSMDTTTAVVAPLPVSAAAGAGLAIEQYRV